jgi:hypothetical protein
MEYYCELIAAIKVRTSNKKGRHLSTREAIRLIEEFGIETPDGLIKAQKSMFKKSTVNRYLQQCFWARRFMFSVRYRLVFQAATLTEYPNAFSAETLRFQKGQQVGVNGIGLGRGHAVRKAPVGFQCAIL